MSKRTRVVAIVLLLLAATTAYEVLISAGAIRLGSLPGEGAPGAAIYGWLAAIGLLAAAVLCAVLVRSGSNPSLAALLAPAAGAFLLAHFHTYDPYYLPALIRYSERDFVPPALVYTLTAAAVAVGIVTFARRRPNLVLSVPAILTCGLAAWWSGIGH